MTMTLTLAFCAGLGARAALNFEECFSPAQPAATFAPVKFAEVFSDAKSWSSLDYSTVFTAALKRGSMPEATTLIVEDMLIMIDFPYYAERLGAAMNASNTGKTKVAPRPTPGAAPSTATPPADSISTN